MNIKSRAIVNCLELVGNALKILKNKNKIHFFLYSKHLFRFLKADVD